MKLRPILILLLFVVSAGILVWIYHATTHKRSDAKTNPWAETLSDLDACSRRKHVKSVQYDHFADIADEENQASAARLFRAMALSERLQENNCAEAMLRFGGKYIPPAKVVVFHGKTAGNLDRSIAFERKSLDELHGADIDRAMEKDNRYAARVLIWATAGDLKHVVLMEGLRDRLPSLDADTSHYQVCPTCGNLYNTKYRDVYCPHCLTDGRKFIHLD